MDGAYEEPVDVPFECDIVKNFFFPIGLKCISFRVKGPVPDQTLRVLRPVAKPAGNHAPNLPDQLICKCLPAIGQVFLPHHLYSMAFFV